MCIRDSSSSFGGGGSQQMGGVQKTTDFLDKSTWILAILLLVLILISNATITENIESNESKLLDGNSIEQVPESIPEIIPNQIPELPTDDGN